MTSHLGTMILFAAAVAVVFALLLREESSEQLAIGARIFGALVLGALLVGWLMFFVAP
ncbi:MAG: hypothetical protein DIU54_009990 [Acidobacteriota bacterium]|jgi:heme/copper-type cytochrome/quinol oxidase subunit 4